MEKPVNGNKPFKPLDQVLKSFPLNSLILFLGLIVIGICVSLLLGFSYKIYIPLMLLTALSAPALKRQKWLMVLLIIIAIAAPVLWYFSVIYRFNNIKPQSLINLPPHMIWAHGGYTQGFDYDSLDSFDAAQRMGYYGIELDIHFLKGKGLVVTHDLPINNVGDQKYLSLQTVFDRYKNQFYYWLDFKNLSNQNARESGELLSRYVETYGLYGHLFVESIRAKALHTLRTIVPGINTIYCLNGTLHIRQELFHMKYQTLIAGADSVTIPEKYVNELFLENFSHLDMNIFTVNDPETAGYLFKKGVRIILSDIDMRTYFPWAYRSAKNSAP